MLSSRIHVLSISHQLVCHVAIARGTNSISHFLRLLIECNCLSAVLGSKLLLLLVATID